MIGGASLGTYLGVTNEMSVKFDAKWYLRRYPDVAKSGLAPWQHYEDFGRAEGRQAGPMSVFGKIRIRAARGRHAVRQVVRNVGGVRAAIKKFFEIVQREATKDVEFDQAYYLKMYPDVLASGMDPKEHYLAFGRGEGRLPSVAFVPSSKGARRYREVLETVLVVSHEASLTGAPVLSLNIVQGLAGRYNVVTLLLNGGSLSGEFADFSVEVFGPARERKNGVAMSAVVSQILQDYPVSFCIANSIETAAVLEGLSKKSIPSVLLVHEFASYTRPSTVFPNAFFWAHEVVFSTELTYKDALDVHPELSGKRAHIIPQGRCVVPRAVSSSTSAGTREKEILRIRRKLGREGAGEKPFVVAGIGYVQVRKGVDHFIECAARLKAMSPHRSWKFVWIGKGFDPEHDMAYSVYLADQVRRSGLSDDVSFIGDTREIEEVYASIDALVLTSRLDPLPNVAIEAMSHGVPTLCFDGTTGIADILREGGFEDECVAPYLDCSSLAEKLVRLIDSPDNARYIGQQMANIADDRFNMGAYLGALEAVAWDARRFVADEQRDAHALRLAGDFDDDYVRNAKGVPVTTEVIRWHHLRPWASKLGRRKPFAGFHPGIYAEEESVAVGARDAYACWVENGKPHGRWNYAVLGNEPGRLREAVGRGLRAALQVHVYYEDLFAEMLRRVSINESRPDLLVSVPSMDVAKRVGALVAAYSGRSVVRVVPNRGRDLGPIFTEFGPTILKEYDVIGHVHTKKTMDLADVKMVDRWRSFLLENVLGGERPMLDRILEEFRADDTVGLIFPDDPNVVGWNLNKNFARHILDRVGLDRQLPDSFNFPVGSMFWARTAALKPLLGAGFEWADYPSEPLPYDGSMLHAMERVLPFVVESQGFRCISTQVPGISR